MSYRRHPASVGSQAYADPEPIEAAEGIVIVIVGGEVRRQYIEDVLHVQVDGSSTGLPGLLTLSPVSVAMLVAGAHRAVFERRLPELDRRRGDMLMSASLGVTEAKVVDSRSFTLKSKALG